MTLKILVLATILGATLGCARAPLLGAVYTDVQTGLTATSNQVGNRVGQACAVSYLGLVALGEATIEEARRNGGITMITSVDDHLSSYGFGIYSKYCLTVRGR